MRISLRLAFRSLARNRRRSALLVALIFAPMFAACTLSVLISTSAGPVGQRATLAIGTAQARITDPSLSTLAPLDARAHGEQTIEALTGDGRGLVPEVAATITLTAGDREVSAGLSGIQDWHSPVFDGRFRLSSGDTPVGSDQIVVSESVAQRLQLGLGDMVQIGDHQASARVTGIGVDPRNTDRSWGVGDIDVISAAAAAPGTRPVVSWLVPEGEPFPFDAVQQQGWRVTDRAIAAQVADPVRGALTVMLVPALVLALAFAGLLAGTGFAMSAADLSRELGLLGVLGATPATVSAVLLFQGLLIGLGAVAAAMAAGITCAVLLTSSVAGWFTEIWGPARPNYLFLLLIGALGLTAACISNALSTRVIRHAPPLAALRPVPPHITVRSSRRGATWALGSGLTLVISLAVLALTHAQALIFFIGVVAVVCAGAAVLASLPFLTVMTSKAPLIVRLATRSIMLTPGRAAGQIAAISAVVLVAGMVLTALGGLTDKMAREHIPALPAGAAMLNTYSAAPASLPGQVAELLGSAQPVRIDYAVWDDGTLVDLDTPSFRCIRMSADCDAAVSTFPGEPQKVGVTDVHGIETILNRPLTAPELRDWDAGTAIALSSELVDDGAATGYSFDGTPARKMSATIAPDTAYFAGSELPNAYISAGAPRSVPMRSGTQTMWYFTPTKQTEGQGVSSDQEDRANHLIATSVADGGYLYVDRGAPAAAAINTIYTCAAAAMFLLVVLLSIVTVALTITDLAPELRALDELGASPRFRRKLAAALAANSAVLGVTVGIVGTAVIFPALAAALGIGWVITPWLVLCGGAAATVAAMAGIGWISTPAANTNLRAPG
ncbi:ABC transporter permease [Rhodococcus erythropolis]|uniref:ABC transporter permease n=1 Tax=Rhodococcus erythropolis TaxID=1833 RepID=UPI0029491935|nr:ABC transporter permease [Rhodococcus erythropolis]MDV6278456.1 ABC transporter permease [Rhodococcus erythropolis]